MQMETTTGHGVGEVEDGHVLLTYPGSEEDLVGLMEHNGKQDTPLQQPEQDNSQPIMAPSQGSELEHVPGWTHDSTGKRDRSQRREHFKDFDKIKTPRDQSCEVCGIKELTERQYGEHINGVKHKKALRKVGLDDGVSSADSHAQADVMSEKIIPKLDGKLPLNCKIDWLDISQVPDITLADRQNFGDGDMKLLSSISTGIYMTKDSETFWDIIQSGRMLTSEEKEKLQDMVLKWNACDADLNERLLRTPDQPVLGLNHIQEVAENFRKKFGRFKLYWCFLCRKEAPTTQSAEQARQMFNHVTSRSHIMKYITEHHSELRTEVRAAMRPGSGPGGFKEALLEVARRIELTDGRGTIKEQHIELIVSETRHPDAAKRKQSEEEAPASVGPIKKVRTESQGQPMAQIGDPALLDTMRSTIKILDRLPICTAYEHNIASQLRNQLDSTLRDYDRRTGSGDVPSSNGAAQRPVGGLFGNAIAVINSGQAKRQMQPGQDMQTSLYDRVYAQQAKQPQAAANDNRPPAVKKNPRSRRKKKNLQASNPASNSNEGDYAMIDAQFYQATSASHEQGQQDQQFYEDRQGHGSFEHGVASSAAGSQFGHEAGAHQ